MPMDAIHQFFVAGSQYYVAGRFAVFGWLNPVAGNLLHHAIEMYLKGGLSKTKSLKGLRAFQHNLPAIWIAFKKDQPTDAALIRFDAVIEALHGYEELRYPDAILAKGMQSTFNILRPDAPIAIEGPKEPKYELCLQDIDELVEAIFHAASRNPKAYLSMLSDCAREFLTKDNKAGGSQHDL